MAKYSSLPAFAFVLISALLGVCKGSIRCGPFKCYGAAYCCASDPNMCCFYIWGVWWFWMLWILFFTLLVSCTFWCRRRYTRREYILVRHPGVPVYGTLPVSSSGTALYGSVPVSGPYAGASGPILPQKPPDYVARPPEYSIAVAPYTGPTAP